MNYLLLADISCMNSSDSDRVHSDQEQYRLQDNLPQSPGLLARCQAAWATLCTRLKLMAKLVRP